MTNPHDVAIELEHMLCKEFGIKGRPRGTIFDADSIELRMFYDDMVLMLYKCAKTDFTDFINEIYQYKSVNMNKISNYEEIFNKFKSYL